MPETRENDQSEEAARRIEKARRSNAVDLDLSFLDLDAIPDSLAKLEQLQSLNLAGNQITVIPDCLAELAQLRGLHLSANHITAIPDSLAQLGRASCRERV